MEDNTETMLEPLQGEKEAESKSDERLGANTPFKTIFILSVGPFIAEIVGAAYAIIDSFWISKACGEDGLAAMSLCSLLDSIGRAFGMFVNVAASSQLAKLRGEKQPDKISQVFADLFRFCFIVGCIVPAILVPCVEPMLKFFGASGMIMSYGKDYIIPLLSGAVVTCLNLFFCGVLQSEGRSFIYGAVQVSSFCLNALVFDPLFMLGFKLGTLGAAVATLCAEAVPMIVVACLFFCGKFDTSATRKELCSKPSPRTWAALKTGFTQFISHICFSIPSFFSRKYVSGAAEASGHYTEHLAAYNVVLRVWQVPASYAIAVSIGMLPSCSYAIGASLPKRVLQLTGWATLLSFVWCSVAELLLITLRKQISMIFGRDEFFVDSTSRMLIISYLFCFSMGAQYVTMSLLQSMQQNVQSIILCILTQFLPVPLFGSILYFTDKSHDVFRLMYMYALNDAFSLVVSCAFVIWPLHKLRKACQGQTQQVPETEVSDLDADEPPAPQDPV